MTPKETDAYYDLLWVERERKQRIQSLKWVMWLPRHYKKGDTITISGAWPPDRVTSSYSVIDRVPVTYE